jgi:hypothetical protein
MATVSRHRVSKVLWAAWPGWVVFAVMATGNHFWLDCVAGAFVGLIAMAIAYRERVFGSFAARPA